MIDRYDESPPPPDSPETLDFSGPSAPILSDVFVGDVLSSLLNFFFN
jgi:hypothetical protein